MHLELLAPQALPKAKGAERPADLHDLVPLPGAAEPAPPKRHKRH